MTLSILYRDDVLVAVDKPAGLLVHRSEIDRRETEFLVQQLRNQIGQRVFPVHRLDKPTSGVMVFALSSHIARLLGEAFVERQVQKQYVAVVRGRLAGTGTIDHPLREKLDRLADRLADLDKPAQPALTHYEAITSVELPVPVGRYASARYSLVALNPHTGRKHQLRRHMKHLSHPILGDTTHGDGRQNRVFRDRFACNRLLLSAVKMTLSHPVTGTALDLRAPVHPTFARVVDALGWRDELDQYLTGSEGSLTLPLGNTP